MSEQELRRWAIEQAIQLARAGVQGDIRDAAREIMEFVEPVAVAAYRGSPWTQERINLLRAKWPTDTPTRAIFALLNDLPGLRLKSIGAVRTYACLHGLKRPDASPNPAKFHALAKARATRAANVAAKRAVASHRVAAE